MKITKTQFDKLYSEDISKKEYDEIIDLINKRFAEICNKILPKNPRRWFDYGNCGYDSDKSEGYFDPDEYKLEIRVGGEYVDLPEPFCNHPYEDENSYLENCFPTRWLWEDFEEEFKNKVKEFKQEQLTKKELKKQKSEESKIKKAKFKEIIRAKLTKEELKYISFK